MTTHASGTFEVQLNPLQKPDNKEAERANVGRMSIGQAVSRGTRSDQQGRDAERCHDVSKGLDTATLLSNASAEHCGTAAAPSCTPAQWHHDAWRRATERHGGAGLRHRSSWRVLRVR